MTASKTPQAIRLEQCSVIPRIASAGPRGPTFGVGSDAWGLNPWATRGVASRAMARWLLRADPCGYS